MPCRIMPRCILSAADDKRRGRLNGISHALSSIPYNRVKTEKVKLPDSSRKNKYNDLD